MGTFWYDPRLPSPFPNISWKKGLIYRSQGAPIAGYLLNAYGGENSTLQAYHPAMFYAGSLALGAAGLVAIVRLKINSRLFQKL